MITDAFLHNNIDLKKVFYYSGCEENVEYLFNKKCERIHFLSQFLWMKGWNIIPKSMVFINMELNLPDIALSTQAFSLGSWLRLRLHLKTKAGSRLWNKSDSRSFSEGCFFFSTVSGFFWQNYRFCSLQRSSICRGQGFCPLNIHQHLSPLP
jgi:hypothetical protein